MSIENSRQIVRELIKDTESRKIRWWNIKDTEWELVFQYTNKITKNKKIKYILTCKREKAHSDLTITFGPVVEFLERGGTLTKEKLISVITPRNQPLLNDLIDQLNRMYDDGDVNYLNENKMNEFHSEDLSTKGRQEKLKNIRLLTTVCKHTDEGTLKWEVNFDDRDTATFIATHQITPKKSLVLSVKCTENSDRREDNIFRCILKNANTTGSISHNVTVIKSLPLNEYPSLIVLIKKLCKKLLNRDFNKIREDRYKLSSKGVAVEVKDEEEYRRCILDTIRVMLKDPKVLEYEKDWGGIYEIYELVKKAKTYEEMNDLLYKAHMISTGKMDITSS